MPDDERLEAIDFHGMELWASIHGDTIADVKVPIAPICRHLGLDIADQRRVIQNSPTFAGRWCLMTLPSRGGLQETFVLQLDMISLWLAGINARRVKDPQKLDRLVLYQRECARVLYDHFFTTPRGRSVQIETQIPLLLDHITELRQDVRTGFAQIESKIEATTFRTQDLVEPIGRETREIREQLQLFGVLLADQRATMDQVASDVEDARPQLRFLTEATSAVRKQRREPTPGQRWAQLAYLRQLELFRERRRPQ
jgi:hypothetical protein